MDKETLRTTVFELLKKTPQTHFHAIENDVRRLDETYERHDVLLLQEVLWELLVQGVLAPGKNSLNLNLPFVHVTPYGAQCLEDGRILVHDPDGYIQHFDRITGHRTDAFITQTLGDALSVFHGSTRSATAVHLARIAEHLFDQLADSLIRTGTRDGKGTKRLESASRFSRSRAQAVIHALEHRDIPSALLDLVEPQLNGLLALMQHARAQDGSPRVAVVTRDQLLGFFMLLPEQCAFVYHLLEALDSPLPA